MTRSNCLRLLVLVLAGCAVPSFAQALLAADTVPFVTSRLEMSFDGNNPGSFILYGNVKHLGQVTGAGINTFTLVGDPVHPLLGVHRGTFTLTRRTNGEKVHIYYESHLTVQNPVNWQGHYWITGGTGRFAGATGEGQIYWGDSSTGLSFKGVISY